MKEYQYEHNDSFTPTLPVAFTPDGLALGGTASGGIPMIEPEKGDVSMIRHGYFEPCLQLRCILTV